MVSVVLIGPHAVGKSTVAATCERRLGWLHHAEVGTLLRETSPNKDWRAPQAAFDDAVLAEESRRDAEFAAASPRASVRVVETWHPGNLGWAGLRGDQSGSALRSYTDAAVAAAVMRGDVLVQELRASPATLRSRRRPGSAAAARVLAGEGGDEALLGLTGRVAEDALSEARRLGLYLLPPLCTDEGSPEAVADALFMALLAARDPGAASASRLSGVRGLFASSADALAFLTASLPLLPRLASAPAMPAFLLAARAAASAPPPQPLRNVVVLEGLDGCGKTTLAASLASQLGATLLRTPPDGPARTLRPLFDAAPFEVGRAFYSLGNAIAAAAAAAAPRGAPIVMDRYHFSTAAYTLGENLATGAPPPAAALAWPPDLPPPALVLLLAMGEEARRARLLERAASNDIAGGEASWSAAEAAQESDAGLGLRIGDAYRALASAAPCAVVVLDAAEGAGEVAAAALRAARAAGVAGGS